MRNKEYSNLKQICPWKAVAVLPKVREKRANLVSATPPNDLKKGEK